MKTWTKLIVIVIVLAAGAWAYHQTRQRKPLRAAAFRNTALTVQYVGAETCRPCHQEIYERFKNTAHARSHSRATPQRLHPYLPANKRVHVANSEGTYHYEFYEKDGRYFFTGYRRPDDTERQTWEIETIIGSGARGFALLSKRDQWQRIAEMPVIYYTTQKRWGFSPDVREDLKSGDTFLYRPIVPICFRCHDTYFESQYPSRRFGREVLGVSCEKCHGPGERHVRERQAEKAAGRRPRRGVDFSIVNPAHLSLERQVDLCGECHSGAIRPYDFGIWEFEYRPGQTLTDFYESVSPNVGAQHTETESLRASDCFKKSRPRITCQTCHEVHSDTSPDDARFNRVCRNCHNGGQVCPPARRVAGGPNAADCVNCHMPKRNVMWHTYFRTHRIAIYRQPLPDQAPLAPEHRRDLAPSN
jgi:hypothetical protein